MGLERLVIADVAKDSGQAPAPDTMFNRERTNLEPAAGAVRPAHTQFKLTYPVIARAPGSEKRLEQFAPIHRIDQTAQCPPPVLRNRCRPTHRDRPMARKSDLTRDEIDIEHPIAHGFRNAQQVIIGPMQIIVVGIKYRDLGHRLHRQELRVQEPRRAILASKAPQRQCRPPESRTLLLQCAVAMCRCNGPLRYAVAMNGSVLGRQYSAVIARQSLLGRPAQTRQIASITLRRPAAPDRVRRLRIHSAPLGPKLALAHRLAGFFVQRLSNRGRAALV